MTIIINPQLRKEVESQLDNHDFLFKVKLLEIKEDTEPNVTSLRKVLKEIKKGYRAEKGQTKSIDVIDKHF